MTNVPPINPDELEILPGPDDDHVTLSFRSDNGDRRDIILDRRQLPAIVGRLAQETGPGQAVPIDKGSLQIGATFAVQGWAVRKATDGSRLLTLMVDLPDPGRVVTIPLELTPADVQALIGQLK